MPDTTQSIQNVEQLLHWGERYLLQANIYLGHGTDNAWDESVALVLYGIGSKDHGSQELLQKHLEDGTIKKIMDLFYTRVKKRIPAPYLTGQAWFCGESYYVDERVIIPRSPIAELIETGFSPWLDGIPVLRILDLCCGSGCIGLASAKAFPEARVDLVDICEDALDVAAINIKRHGLGARVTCLHSDLFESLGDASYDLIVSNPPYVDAADLATMPREFEHEPTLALTAGTDGLDLVTRILCRAKEYLSASGLLVVEVGNSEEALIRSYPDMPFTWAEFDRGGHGVFLLEAEQLA
ncbi:MAG: 50S ribosomal protein L3 N(5)-glutamine methyltransferase [Gammaproteobacteria bacterium]|nr:50S ribosomal protein L3 N(5)-glutamine methyltransferase [Gammaproteobacteria bacterium]